MSKRNPAVLGEWGPAGKRVLAKDAAWREVERWNRKAVRYLLQCPKCGFRVYPPAVCPTTGCNTFASQMTSARHRVFCASMSDWLDPRVPVEWLARLLDLIRRCPNLDFLLLTKRPENWSKRLRHVLDNSWSKRAPLSQQHDWVASWQARGEAPRNVWLGVSAEDQQRWDERVPVLLSIPARVRFVSAEPMLGPIYMNENWMLSGHSRKKDKSLMPRGSREHVDWIIFGGESGPKARPCNVDWIRDGLRQCLEAGVKPFVKQIGSNAKGSAGADYTTKDRKGGDPSEWPEDLRVREWPEVKR